MINAKAIVVATLTLSDSAASGARSDDSGAILRVLLGENGYSLMDHKVLPDDREMISKELLASSESADAIITTGGTGISPGDVTPEATLAVIDRRIPGIEEALHLSGGDRVPTGILSRAVAGNRGTCLIVNLPGSPGGVRDGMKILLPILPHAVRLLRGHVRDCASDLERTPGENPDSK